jgi:hypothetical protein
MDISNSGPQIGSVVEMAVQKLVLDTTKNDGIGLISLIASGPAGSTNLPTQGHYVDARA